MSTPKAGQEWKHNSPSQHSLLSPNTMDFSENAATTNTITETSPTSSFSPTSSHSSPNSPPSVLPPVILTPCAACKILRRRCIDKCVLAPYFPPTEPVKFTIAHRVFGASNIIKLLQVNMLFPSNENIRSHLKGISFWFPTLSCSGIAHNLHVFFIDKSWNRDFFLSITLTFNFYNLNNQQLFVRQLLQCKILTSVRNIKFYCQLVIATISVQNL